MNYYIDSKCGKDTNDGTKPDQAFATIEKINSIILSPGTTVYLKSGCIWNTPLVPAGSGDENGYIEITRYGVGAAPVINGNGADSAVKITNMSYLILDGIEVTNISDDKDGFHCGIYLLYQGGTGGEYRNIVIRNIYVHDIVSKYNRGAGGIIIWADKAENPVTFNHLTVENCRIKNTGAQGITFSSEYSARIGIDWAKLEYAPSKNITIKNNYITDCGGDGIFQSCAEDPVIEHNTVARCCFAGNTAYAGIWPHNSQNTVMQYNEAFDNKLVYGDGQGYDVDIDCTNTVVRHNYSHHNEGGFILLCTSGDIGGYNNDITVENNVSLNDSGQIFTLSGPIKNIKLKDNRVIVEKNLGTRLIGMYMWGDTGGGPDDVLIENNIFYLNTDGKNQFYKDSHFLFSGNTYGGIYDYSDITDTGGKYGFVPDDKTVSVL